MQTGLGKVVMRNFFELLRRSDGVFVFTEAEREEMIRLGVPAENICLIGVGPLLSDEWDAEDFKQRYGIRDKMVLFLGQKLAYKGFDALVDAAKLVWEKHPETSFVFIGPHYDESKAIIERLNDPRIVDIPRVDAFDPVKASALAACDVFALPSRQEGIGGVYIEAWAMSKPVIGCKIPFLTIRDGDDGYLVEQTPAALSEKIVHLLDHPEMARQMGARGHARVEGEYSWEAIVSKVEAFYHKLRER
jgi:glycosyltransferase involved in cell wall biosynthesis